ncbi:MAG: hypothetical protein JWR24_420 [Actinoallomurus sp.]|nr:hypothetical protein [Actinoallomurus sp.]
MDAPVAPTGVFPRQPYDQVADLAGNGWAALKVAGLIPSANGPHHADVADDVRYSLRCLPDEYVARNAAKSASPDQTLPW